MSAIQGALLRRAAEAVYNQEVVGVWDGVFMAVGWVERRMMIERSDQVEDALTLVFDGVDDLYKVGREVRTLGLCFAAAMVSTAGPRERLVGGRSE